jgi:hypothetical protein
MSDTIEARPPAELVRLARATLLGDVRDAMLDTIVREKRTLPFNMLPEADQRTIVQRVSEVAQSVIDGVVEIVAADGREPMTFSVAKVEKGAQGDVVLKLKTPFSDEAWRVLGGTGTVQVIAADSQPYTGEKRSAESRVTPDQGELIKDDGKAQDEGDDGAVFDNTAAGKRTGAERHRAPGEAARAPLPPDDWKPDPVTGLLKEEAQQRFGRAVKERMEVQGEAFDVACEACRKAIKVKKDALNIPYIQHYIGMIDLDDGDDAAAAKGDGPAAAPTQPAPAGDGLDIPPDLRRTKGDAPQPPQPPADAGAGDTAGDDADPPPSGLPGEGQYTAPRAKNAYRVGARDAKVAFTSGQEAICGFGGAVLAGAWKRGHDDMMAKLRAEQAGGDGDGDGPQPEDA